MKSMNIRGISEALDNALKQSAKDKGISINQAMLEALKSQFGLTKKKRFTNCYDDLDHLFGRWSQKDYETVQGKIDAERTIDPDLWR